MVRYARFRLFFLIIISVACAVPQMAIARCRCLYDIKPYMLKAVQSKKQGSVPVVTPQSSVDDKNSKAHVATPVLVPFVEDKAPVVQSEVTPEVPVLVTPVAPEEEEQEYCEFCCPGGADVVPYDIGQKREEGVALGNNQGVLRRTITKLRNYVPTTPTSRLLGASAGVAGVGVAALLWKMQRGEDKKSLRGISGIDESLRQIGLGVSAAEKRIEDLEKGLSSVGKRRDTVVVQEPIVTPIPIQLPTLVEKPEQPVNQPVMPVPNNDHRDEFRELSGQLGALREELGRFLHGQMVLVGQHMSLNKDQGQLQGMTVIELDNLLKAVNGFKEKFEKANRQLQAQLQPGEMNKGVLEELEVIKRGLAEMCRSVEGSQSELSQQQKDSVESYERLGESLEKIGASLLRMATTSNQGEVVSNGDNQQRLNGFSEGSTGEVSLPNKLNGIHSEGLASLSELQTSVKGMQDALRQSEDSMLKILNDMRGALEASKRGIEQPQIVRPVIVNGGEHPKEFTSQQLDFLGDLQSLGLDEQGRRLALALNGMQNVLEGKVVGVVQEQGAQRKLLEGLKSLLEQRLEQERKTEEERRLREENKTRIEVEDAAARLREEAQRLDKEKESLRNQEEKLRQEKDQHAREEEEKKQVAQAKAAEETRIEAERKRKEAEDAAARLREEAQRLDKEKESLRNQEEKLRQEKDQHAREEEEKKQVAQAKAAEDARIEVEKKRKEAEDAAARLREETQKSKLQFEPVKKKNNRSLLPREEKLNVLIKAVNENIERHNYNVFELEKISDQLAQATASLAGISGISDIQKSNAKKIADYKAKIVRANKGKSTIQPRNPVGIEANKLCMYIHGYNLR